jgi:simple sugar transport system ATP-binding protein
MVGRAVDLIPNKSIKTPGEVVLSIKNLNIFNSVGRNIVKNVSFEIRSGEILAIAGVQGNGQSEIARAIINLEDHVSGSIKVKNLEISGKSVKDSLGAGIAFIPESREIDGLIENFSISENLILDTHDMQPSARNKQLVRDAINSSANLLIKEFDIRTQSIFDKAYSLSGGNKQKVVLARELTRKVDLVVASQPTRGLDVGSIEFVYERLLAERESNKAVLLISSELDEVAALADRIAVIYKGEIVGIVGSDVTREKLGLMMAGIA